MSHPARAIVCYDTHDNGGWKLEDVTVRGPGEGELLVEMAASGICHTDALIGGTPGGATPIAFYPRILGHEGSGYVKEVGPGVTVAAVGDPVLLSFAFCNKCEICKAGRVSHCNKFTEDNFGGPYNVFKVGDKDISGQFFGQSSFASLSVVKECSVVNAKGLVADKKELQLFAPLGCGIQTGSGTVINAAEAGPEDVVLVMGLGGVGLSAIMGAKIAGCRKIVGLDRIKSRLEFAKQLGATDVINGAELPEGKDLAEALKEVCDGEGPSICIDTSGAPPLIKAGFASVRNRGKYVQVGSAPFDFSLELNLVQFMLEGKQIFGAIEGHAYPPEFVPKMIKWYKEGKFPVDKLMKFIKAEDFEQGLKEMHDGTTIKPIMCWS
ncbi:chaperonin 10-like protein [Neohortaea acidophila]|uniref:Chaperonin 10-like protein n=1 Tax=Neohortaea acidophila TaxID=245834 RepID=A0A6A6Q157_9PEZI|nr:chaperonin 10-like protein [Neohortaea acidophila]KAF2486208.1 chaperonin 10-like protein [Neohortaea acidophila]